MSNSIPDRLLRFSLHATKNIKEQELFRCVELALGEIALKKLPDIFRVDRSFWAYHAKNGRRPDRFRYTQKQARRQPEPYLVDDVTFNKRRAIAKSGQSAGLPIKLESIVSDKSMNNPKSAPKDERHQFFILTLPYYEGTFRRQQCKPNGVLFDIAYHLRKSCKLTSVTPDLQYPHYQLFSSSSSGSSSGSSSSPDDSRKCITETDKCWHLDNINYDAVPSGIDGTGIRIGHPDTGWTPHPELNFEDGSSPSFDLSADVNIINPNSTSAEEPVPAANVPNAHHGTATGGLLISRSGDSNDKVKGVAPGATVVSIRAIEDVKLIGPTNVTEAISAAVDAGVHVISLSLGGYPAPSLEEAINKAVFNDVIVVAAAGNVMPDVVYPAAYPWCISVGGSTFRDTVWSGSSRDLTFSGKRIDISAPAEYVCVPNWAGAVAIAGAYSGTSFATAIVAGAAALWLQTFGRDSLIGSLAGAAPLQALFRAYLRRTARRPANWDELRDGPGILDLKRLLTEEPDPSQISLPPMDNDLGINNSFGSTPPQWMQAVFGNNLANMLEQAGEEIVTLVMSNPGLGALTQALNDVGEAIEDANDAVENAVDDALEEAEEFAEEVVEEAEDLVDEFIDKATESASDFLSGLAGWF